MSLLSCSIPGVFPESPRWLLLSERSGDMNSFTERRNSNRDVRDDESFTGVCSFTVTDQILILSLKMRAAHVFLHHWMDIQFMKAALFMLLITVHLKTRVTITHHYQGQIITIALMTIPCSGFLKVHYLLRSETVFVHSDPEIFLLAEPEWFGPRLYWVRLFPSIESVKKELNDTTGHWHELFQKLSQWTLVYWCIFF